MKIGYEHAPTLAWLSEGYLLDARRDEAAAAAQREVDRSSQRGHRGHEAYGLRMLAEISASRDPIDVEGAKGFYDRALVLLARGRRGDRSAALAGLRQALRHDPRHADARALLRSLGRERP